MGKVRPGWGTKVLKVAAEDGDGTKVPSSQSKSLKQGKDRQTDRQQINKEMQTVNGEMAW